MLSCSFQAVWAAVQVGRRAFSMHALQAHLMPNLAIMQVQPPQLLPWHTQANEACKEGSRGHATRSPNSTIRA